MTIIKPISHEQKTQSTCSRKSQSLKPGNLDIKNALEQAEALIQDGKPDQAIELLKPLAERFKRDGNLQYHLGYAYTKAGDAWRGVDCYRKALELLRDPGLWIPLGYLYLSLELRVLGLDALRRAIRHDPDHPLPSEAIPNLLLIELEAAAIIEDDQVVYRLAKEIEQDISEDRAFAKRMMFYEAVAEANLGMRSAWRKLNQLKEEYHWADELLQALKNGQPGLGWSQRFPYFHARW